MVTNLAGPDDQVTEPQVAYYRERARGGSGTIIVEASHVAPDARITSRQIGSYHDRFIPGLSRLADAIKSEGAIALLQLCHGGPKTLTAPGGRPRSVSPVAIRKGDEPRPLTLPELKIVRRDFLASALRARTAGFDGIEIHAAHLYLLSASISPFTNRRTDAYGGNLVNRTRLTREIIDEIKSAPGGDFAVWVRIHAREAFGNGLTLREGKGVARLLAKAGADVLHVSAYTLPMNPALFPLMKIRVGAIPLRETSSGPFLNYAAAIRRTAPVPVVAVGKLDDPALCAKALLRAKCDLIALGRQLLCDPYWPSKVKEGRTEEIIRCTYCMTCHRAQQSGKRIKCALNLNISGMPRYGRKPSISSH
jgi:2,4-dienoyl-CoA reductase-like NADH-dependent reductase (Old Yellow Enzyme family)